ncbi:MAG: hypothetical protein ACRDA0_00765 [Cetobacterium sp.]|uniref:hypothetical protein n=1 Tax=Cetobacterium sp. TaxID=2071632 RepID=UPI003EE54692
MSRVIREKVEPKNLVLKRYRGDRNYTIAGTGTELKHGQAMAIKATDGKLYTYDKDGADGLNIPIGIYVGNTKTSSVDFKGSITTSADVLKDKVVGIEFATDFNAIIELQKMGTFILDAIEGKEVNE